MHPETKTPCPTCRLYLYLKLNFVKFDHFIEKELTFIVPYYYH
jgi:hypothetical protein